MKHMVLGAALAAFSLLAQQAARDAATDPLSLEHDGVIEPSIEINISSPVDGLIETTPVDRGDLVEVGDVVATLESSVERATRDYARAQSELKAALESTRARMEFATRLLDNNRKLHAEGIISPEELDQFQTDRDLAVSAHLQAQENVRLAELDLARAEANLALRTIRTPVRGVVVERFLTSGELVSRSKESDIMKIAQLDPLHVEVIAPVVLFGKVTVGMEAEVRPEEPLVELRRARVKVVDQVVDAASSTFGVRLVLDNPDYALPAGLKCKVRFLLPE